MDEVITMSHVDLLRSAGGARPVRSTVATAERQLESRTGCCLACPYQRRHVRIDDRREVQSHKLRHDQAADNGEAEWPTRLAAGSEPHRDWQRPEQRGHRCHHDRTETDQASLMDGLGWRLAAVPLGV